VFDLSPAKLLVLAVLALIVFGPHELPKIAQQIGRMLRDLRRVAESAKMDLREGLGPEFQDFDFNDLNPRQFVRKHLLDDMGDVTRPLYEEFTGTAASVGAAGAGGAAFANGARPAPPDGAEPPFDIEAT
jgi:sec-independent protein translocase protein TatB